VLSELRVENLGIISELLLPVGAGMTVITGETGAGKTLLVDALELVCGGRADPQMVREGAQEARVEARLVDGGGEEIVLARVVPAVGRSRGYINGRLATASELAERGRSLVDLHGQHAHQSLLSSVEQRALLDRAAGDAAEEARRVVREARAEVRLLDAELEAMGGDEHARAREVDLLRYQLAEIDAAALTDVDEDAHLAVDEALLADAEAHRAALDSAYAQLEGPAEDALGAAVAVLAGREPFDAFVQRLRALQGEIAEAAHDIRVTAEETTADPDRLAEVQRRRALLHELMRKYGPTLGEVSAFAEQARQRVDDLTTREARAGALTAARVEAEQRAGAAAARLSALRREHAGSLAEAVTAHLHDLAMPVASFEVGVEPAEATDDGADEVTFLLAPNRGEPLRPLARAASGGELSRAMLALRVVLSEAPPTLVFDEVDAGIGGEAGVAVGRALATLGGKHQVLCVTHLAQVAAFADAHVSVTKAEARGRTIALAELVLDDARVAEVSRMLAGVGDSSHANEHARELLARAADTRTKVRAR
jgi:DNA repair protein RecN (Recombination protein N)